MRLLRAHPFDKLRERRTRNDRFYENESHKCTFKLMIQSQIIEIETFSGFSPMILEKSG